MSPRRPVAGSPFFVVATLYNGGLAKAGNINVAATTAEGFVPVTSTRQVVSRLAPQEASAVGFGINATRPLAGNVAVRVEYVGAYGRRYSDEAVIPVAVYARQPEQRGNSPGWTSPAALAAVLLVVALRGGRKGRGRENRSGG